MGNCAGYCNGQGEEDGQIGRESLKNKGALIKPDSDDYDLEKKYGGDQGYNKKGSRVLSNKGQADDFP